MSGVSVVAIASVIRFFRCCWTGEFERRLCFLCSLKRKETKGLESELLGGHSRDPALPIHFRELLLCVSRWGLRIRTHFKINPVALLKRNSTYFQRNLKLIFGFIIILNSNSLLQISSTYNNCKSTMIYLNCYIMKKTLRLS